LGTARAQFLRDQVANKEPNHAKSGLTLTSSNKQLLKVSVKI